MSMSKKHLYVNTKQSSKLTKTLNLLLRIHNIRWKKSSKIKTVPLRHCKRSSLASIKSDPGSRSHSKSNMKEKRVSSSTYLVEPRVMEDIETLFMDDGGTVAFRCGERSDG